MGRIDEFKNNLLTSIEEVNKNTDELRMNSDLRVTRRYCENNFIELVNDCYEFLKTLKTKKEKEYFKTKCTIILDSTETRILISKQKII